MRRTATTMMVSISLLLVLASAAQANQTVYRWVDDEGVVHFGDSVPAEYAEQEKLILNEQGIEVGRIAGKATAEELAALKAQAEAEAAKERARRADQALLATYLSMSEIERHRDRSVEQLDARARVTDIYLNNQRQYLNSLLKEASGFKPYTVDPDAPMIRPELADKIKETKDLVLKYEARLADHRRAADELRSSFAVAMARYSELTKARNN